MASCSTAILSAKTILQYALTIAFASKDFRANGGFDRSISLELY